MPPSERGHEVDIDSCVVGWGSSSRARTGRMIVVPPRPCTCPVFSDVLRDTVVPIFRSDSDANFASGNEPTGSRPGTTPNRPRPPPPPSRSPSCPCPAAPAASRRSCRRSCQMPDVLPQVGRRADRSHALDVRVAPQREQPGPRPPTIPRRMQMPDHLHVVHAVLVVGHPHRPAEHGVLRPRVQVRDLADRCPLHPRARLDRFPRRALRVGPELLPSLRVGPVPMNALAVAPRSMSSFASPSMNAMSPPMCGWAYASATFVPNRRLHGSEGTRKLDEPKLADRIDHHDVPAPPLEVHDRPHQPRVVRRRVVPIKDTRSARSRSSRPTVDVLHVPVTCDTATPDAWWQKNEQLLTLLVPYTREQLQQERRLVRRAAAEVEERAVGGRRLHDARHAAQRFLPGNRPVRPVPGRRDQGLRESPRVLELPGEKPAKWSSEISKKPGRIAPCISAAIACTDFLHTFFGSAWPR